MHCKIMFNFALRHGLALLQDNRSLALASGIPLHGQLAESTSELHLWYHIYIDLNIQSI